LNFRKDVITAMHGLRICAFLLWTIIVIISSSGCGEKVVVVEVPRSDIDISAQNLGSEYFSGEKESSEYRDVQGNEYNQIPQTNGSDDSRFSMSDDSILIESFSIGSSVNGLPIEVTQLGNGQYEVVIIGGMHAGFAPASVDVANKVVDYFRNFPSTLPDDISLYVIPIANPDSAAGGIETIGGRLNGNGVDINRNWGCNWTRDATWRDKPISSGTSAFSEPETRILRDFIITLSPHVTILFEAKGKMIAPGTCGNTSQVERLARIYGTDSGYKIGQITGYSVSGDSSDWLTQEGYPAFAVLLPDYSSPDWTNNLNGINSLISHISESN
jgi:hypothetical protein